MTLEEKFKAPIKSYLSVSSSNQALKNQNEYLRCQLGEVLIHKKKVAESRTESDHAGESEAKSNAIESASEQEPPRRSRRERKSTSNSNDFRVNIPEFEGKLDPEELLDWISRFERVFGYKKIPQDKNVKLVALKL